MYSFVSHCMFTLNGIRNEPFKHSLWWKNDLLSYFYNDPLFRLHVTVKCSVLMCVCEENWNDKGLQNYIELDNLKLYMTFFKTHSWIILNQ